MFWTLSSILNLLLLVSGKNEKLFYVYDWSDIINLSHSKSFTFTKRLSYEASDLENYGCGPLMNQDIGLYQSHQYMVFELFYHRLLESFMRTTDPNEASIFFIPYDIGIDSTTRRSDGALTNTKCPNLNIVLNRLKEQPYFNRNYGRDHFILTSINQPMGYYLNKDCRKFYDNCWNCTKLGIDNYPHYLFNELKIHKSLVHKWISIPFPSNYHHSKLVKYKSWLIENNRNIKITFQGSPFVTSKKGKILRKLILKECKRRNNNDNNECHYNKLKTHHSNTKLDINLYYQSELCLMPQGDFPTRKGVLDALFAGCIPVVFNLYTAHKQWLNHWENQSIVYDLIEYIPYENVIDNIQNTFDHLIGLAQNKIELLRRRKLFNTIAFRMQYNKFNGGSKEIDAVDVFMNKLLS